MKNLVTFLLLFAMIKNSIGEGLKKGGIFSRNPINFREEGFSLQELKLVKEENSATIDSYLFLNTTNLSFTIFRGNVSSTNITYLSQFDFILYIVDESLNQFDIMNIENLAIEGNGKCTLIFHSLLNNIPIPTKWRWVSVKKILLIETVRVPVFQKIGSMLDLADHTDKVGVQNPTAIDYAKVNQSSPVSPHRILFTPFHCRYRASCSKIPQVVYS